MDEAGRWQGARQAFSPNCAPRPEGERVTLAVIHNISLPPFKYGTGAVEKLFANRINEAEHPFFSVIKDLRVSSHFFIARTGETVQFVSCDEAAYHAGVSSFGAREGCNAFSVGIEMEGCDFEPFAEAQYGQPAPPAGRAVCALSDRGGNGARAHRAGAQNRSGAFFRLGAGGAVGFSDGLL